MRPEDARALLVCQNEAEATRLSAALQDIGLSQIRILVEECPNSAYAAMLQSWDLDIVVTDTEFAEAPLLALTKLFPEALLLLLNSKPAMKKAEVQRAVIKYLRGVHKQVNSVQITA